jgi:nucleoside-diphosphate-sugar epimerase
VFYFHNSTIPFKTTNFALMLQKEILVTGAAGYIGSVLCRQLLEQGYRVRGVDVLLFGDAGIQSLVDHPHFQFLQGDLCDAGVRALALKGVWAVVHLAAIVGDPACKRFPDEATALMDGASRALFEEAEVEGVERFVFASTCSNYGQMGDGEVLLDEDSPLQPQSHYARLKVGFEEYLQNKMGAGKMEAGIIGTNRTQLGRMEPGMIERGNTEPNKVAVSVLRFATAYGLSPRMRFDLTVNHFTRDIVLGKELLVFGEHQWRPYCHVQNLAQACCLCLNHPTEVATGIFNVGDTEENYSKAMIVAEILKQVPEGKIRFGAQPDLDSRNYRVSFEKVTRRLQFVATRKVPDGIREIHGFLKGGKVLDPFDPVYENC